MIEIRSVALYHIFHIYNQYLLLIHSNSSSKNLTWHLENSNNDKIHDTKVRDVLRKAFKKWSGVTNLDFSEESKSPDIRVRFEQGQHKDVFAFDGPGGVLAHAFYPSPDPTDGKSESC